MFSRWYKFETADADSYGAHCVVNKIFFFIHTCSVTFKFAQPWLNLIVFADSINISNTSWIFQRNNRFQALHHHTQTTQTTTRNPVQISTECEAYPCTLVHGNSRKGFVRCRLRWLWHYIHYLSTPLHTALWWMHVTWTTTFINIAW